MDSSGGSCVMRRRWAASVCLSGAVVAVVAAVFVWRLSEAADVIAAAAVESGEVRASLRLLLPEINWPRTSAVSSTVDRLPAIIIFYYNYYHYITIIIINSL